MNIEEVLSLAIISGVLLIIWELLKGRWQATILSIIATLLLVSATTKVMMILSALLVVPVVFEERWNKRANKDMVRGVLAAVIIGSVTAFIIVN